MLVAAQACPGIEYAIPYGARDNHEAVVSGCAVAYARQ
jgi:hypothetical protein